MVVMEKRYIGGIALGNKISIDIQSHAITANGYKQVKLVIFDQYNFVLYFIIATNGIKFLLL